jgi:hypothetical protein
MELLLVVDVIYLLVMSVVGTYLLANHDNRLRLLSSENDSLRELVVACQQDIGFLSTQLQQHISHKPDVDRLADVERKLAGIMLKVR